MSLTVGVDSYISLTDANTYFNSRYNSGEWALLEDSVKETLLKSAVRVIDVYCDFKGWKTDEDQLLEFPRNDEDIPENIKIAQCEIAFAIYNNENINDEKEAQLTKLKVDIIEFNWSDLKMKTSTLYSDFTKALLKKSCISGNGTTKVIRS